MSDEPTPPTTALAPIDNRGDARIGITPTNIHEAMELAVAFAKSGLVPKGYDNKPEAILVAIQLGAEIGFPPMQALQGIMVTGGRPALWGDAMLALIMRSPLFGGLDEYFEILTAPGVWERVERLSADAFKNEATSAVCSLTRKGEAPTIRRFSIAQAKRAGLWTKPGPWQQYPDRMLAMRARGFAARDAFPDLLRGLRSAEEVLDIPPMDDTPRPAPRVKRISDPPAPYEIARDEIASPPDDNPAPTNPPAIPIDDVDLPF